MILRNTRQDAADFSFLLSRILMYTGVGALAFMAVVGTMAIDMVLIAAAQKNHDSFATGFILGMIFTSSHTAEEMMWLLIASPITSAIAIALAYALEVPAVGVGILIGWGVAVTLLFLAAGFYDLGNALNTESVPTTPSPFSFSLASLSPF